MRTVMFPTPIHVCIGDTININYTDDNGNRVDRIFHSFSEPRVFNRIIVDECTTEDLDRFGITDGFIMILANGVKA